VASTATMPTKGNPSSLHIFPSKSSVLGMCAIADGMWRVEPSLISAPYWCRKHLSYTIIFSAIQRYDVFCTPNVVYNDSEVSLV
jgi:hypothetical protein